jgi:transposase InsO family protein
MLDRPRDEMLEDKDGPSESPPSLNDLMADDLERNDRVIIDDEPLDFLAKPDKEPHFFIDKNMNKRPFWTTELWQLQSEGRYYRPGRPTPAAPIGPNDEKLKHQDRELFDRCYLALGAKPRAKASAKWMYVERFVSEMRLAEGGGKKFDQSHDNAKYVIGEVDKAIAAMNKDEDDPAKLILTPKRSTRTVLRWVATALRRNFHQASLLHANATRRHSRKLPQIVFDLIVDQIRELVDVSPKLGPTKVLIELKGKIAAYNRKNGTNVPVPKLTTVQNEYRRFDAWVRLAKKKGAKAADLEFGLIGKLVRPSRILDLVELDHHKFDLHGIFGATPLGKAVSKSGLDRFWVCLALDVHSGYPLGFAISFEPGGLLPALMCIDHAIRPKPYVKDRWPDIRGELLGCGKPVRFRYDNAKEFISLKIQGVLARIGVGFQLAIPGQPQSKPYVERHFGTIEQDFVHWLKGTTGSNVKEKAHRNPVQEAIIPWDDFSKLFHMYLIECYARRPQEDLDWESPEQRWMRGASSRAHRPRPLTKDEQQRWDIIMSPELELTATNEGIRWERLCYQSEELQEIRRHAGYHGDREEEPTPVTVRLPLLDISKMYVADPTSPDQREPGSPNEIIVPCKNQHVKDRTVWQHQVVLGYLRRVKGNPENLQDYEDGFRHLFNTALETMGVTRPGEPHAKGRLSGGQAPRFTGAFLGGADAHALKRPEEIMERYNLSGDAAPAEPEAAPPEPEAPAIQPAMDPSVDAPPTPAEQDWTSDPLDDPEDVGESDLVERALSEDDSEGDDDE